MASKLIASAAELDEIAAGERNGSSLKGWRHEVFGKDAIKLCDGELALRAKGQSVEVLKL